MIEMKVDRDRVSVEVSGSTAIIPVEIGLAVHHICATLCRLDPDRGEAFKMGIQRVILSEDSPVWKITEVDQ